ncbi:YHS domain-containing (seleno)protein [Sphingorhabdus sp. Alg231-15]|uniref:YHS domain-containing (seleno)protein n=1 Tax=Sphingorhabdus sp. Alg231-15 TaxID=1922222 RepID=UPI000D5516A8
MKNLIMPLALALTATTGTFALPIDAAIAGPTYTGVKGGNTAVGGYDVTSYFTGSGVPVKGSKAHKVKYKGADYFFSTAANAKKFKEKPAQFAPQYGGHCAWALSRGSLAPGDPLVYKVVGGKLYLNVNKQVQKTWLTDVAGFIKKADINWPKFPDNAKFGG